MEMHQCAFASWTPSICSYSQRDSILLLISSVCTSPGGDGVDRYLSRLAWLRTFVQSLGTACTFDPSVEANAICDHADHELKRPLDDLRR
jgi:hypothetical protein